MDNAYFFNIEYTNDLNEKEWLTNNATMWKVWKLSHRIIQFEYEFVAFAVNDDKKAVKIIEELIHQCLPDPDDEFLSPQNDPFNGYRWMVCLYDLVNEHLESAPIECDF